MFLSFSPLRSIGLHREAEMIEQQLKMKQNTGPIQMPAANGNSQSMAAAAQQQAQSGAVAGGGAGGGGSAGADYSKQWAEYYRSIGKVDEAEAIENQIKTKVNIQTTQLDQWTRFKLTTISSNSQELVNRRQH